MSILSETQPQSNDGCPDGENPPPSCLENCEEAESYSPPTKIVMPPPSTTAGPRTAGATTTQPAANSDSLVLPHSDDAEAGLLGGLMMYPESSAEYIAKLSADDFATSTGRAIFSAYNRLNAGGQTIILAAVESILKSQNANWPDIENFLTRGCDLAIISGTIPANFQVVKKLSNERRKISATHKLHRAVVDGATPESQSAAMANLIAAMTGPAERPKLETMTADKLIFGNPELMPPLIHGLLRQREVANLVAASKTGKSWIVHHLLMAAIMGTTWLGHRCEPTRALLIDAELHGKTLAYRLKKVAETYGLGPDALAGIATVCLRDTRMAPDAVWRAFESVELGTYGLIVIDTLYRLLPAGTDENSNSDITAIYNRLDSIAERTGAAILIVHHASKGTQSNKSISDVGSGAGAQSRAADAHIILRPHKEPGVIVLDSIVRSFPPEPPTCWLIAPPELSAYDADPTELRSDRPKAKTADPKPERPAKPTWATVAGLAGETPRDAAWFSAELGISERCTKELLRQSVAKKAIHLWQGKDRRTADRWAKNPMPLTG